MLRHVLSSSNEQITLRGNDYAVVSDGDMPDVLFFKWRCLNWLGICNGDCAHSTHRQLFIGSNLSPSYCSGFGV